MSLENFMRKTKEIQKKFDQLQINGESGAGMVKVIMTGRHDIKSISIDSDLLKNAIKSQAILQDLIAASINDANKKLEKKPH